MQAHQQRVVDEKSALDEKLQKLGSFLETPVFSGLPADERSRLIVQEYLMDQYSHVLGERIAAFT